jgi:hypothetical protein
MRHGCYRVIDWISKLVHAQHYRLWRFRFTVQEGTRSGCLSRTVFIIEQLNEWFRKYRGVRCLQERRVILAQLLTVAAAAKRQIAARKQRERGRNPDSRQGFSN